MNAGRALVMLEAQARHGPITSVAGVADMMHLDSIRFLPELL